MKIQIKNQKSTPESFARTGEAINNQHPRALRNYHRFIKKYSHTTLTI